MALLVPGYDSKSASVLIEDRETNKGMGECYGNKSTMVGNEWNKYRREIF
jgi:hypothetical protein